MHGFYNAFSGQLRQVRLQEWRILVTAQRVALYREERPGIQSIIHEHRAYSGLLIATEDRRRDGRSASMSRKQ
jgi:hypothetical protein